MSDKQIAAMLPHLFAIEDPRLNQYLAAIYERGFSLRAIGEVAGVTYETIRLRLLKAAEEQARGDIKDLSGLPSVTSLPVKRRAGSTYYLSEPTKNMLATLNREAQQYRPGRDDVMVRTFNMLVLELTAQGIPFPAIAEACGQDSRQLRRRLKRWDVYPEKSRSREWPKLVAKPGPIEVIEDTPAPEPAPVRLRVCKHPDCPANSGGECIH